MYFVSYFPPLSFLQMHNMHPRGLRTHSKLYNCVFMGERSQDAGGPYRESWSMYAQELQVLATIACRFVPVARRAPRNRYFHFPIFKCRRSCPRCGASLFINRLLCSSPLSFLTTPHRVCISLLALPLCSPPRCRC